MADHLSSGTSACSKLGTQAVGLITVLAISGSVVLLTLGKQKLFYVKNYVFESVEDNCPDSESGDSQGLPSLTLFRSTSSRSSDLQTNRGKVRNSSSNSLSNEKRNSLREGDTKLHSSHSSRSCLSRLSSVKSPCVQRASLTGLACSSVGQASLETGEKRRSVLKKVRFSAEVIEPSGNNQEYRRRAKSRVVLNRKTDATDQRLSNFQDKSGNSRLNDSQDTSYTSTQSGVSMSPNGGTLEGGHSNGQNSTRRSSQEWRVQTLAKPKLPANRLALYNGLNQSRLQQRCLYC